MPVTNVQFEALADGIFRRVAVVGVQHQVGAPGQGRQQWLQKLSHDVLAQVG